MFCSFRRPITTGLILLLAAACSGPTDSNPTDTLVAGPPARLERYLDPRTAPAGTVTEITVRVADARGRPVEGVDVRWVTGNGAGITANAHKTDADGLATAAWWLGSVATTYSASAHAAGMVITFTLTATPPPSESTEPARASTRDAAR